MKTLKLLVTAVVLAVIGFYSTATAQSDLVVEWADGDGNVITNALRDAIANDSLRPDDRVYKLQRGGFYWNEDRMEVNGFHLRLIGETGDEADPASFVCGAAGDEDCGPAIIQRLTRSDGSLEGQMLNTSGSESHVTVKNIWIMGQGDQGQRTSWQPWRMQASNSTTIFDNVVFDRNNWQHLGDQGSGNSLYVTNSVFRNLYGPAQQWEGMGMQFDGGADTVVVENNTFINLGFTIMKSEAAPINYYRVNHNTFVNVGRTFSSGAIWKEAYVANNVFVNYAWHGEQPSEYEDPNRVSPDGLNSFFGIAGLPSQFGTDLDRRIVLANNSFWRDEAFAAGYPDDIITVPVINDTTAGWFAALGGAVMQDNLLDADPGLGTYPSDIIPDMIANITELRGGSSEAQLYDFDPGRDEECFVCNIWPLPEDFTYSNADMMTAGTDGLPLGDLNWYPDAKADFEANKDAYVAAIEDLAGARLELNILATGEADEGTLGTGASVETVEGFTYYKIEASGSIAWDFEIPEAGTYDLLLSTKLTDGTKGQHLSIDGNRFKNQAFAGNGEFVFDQGVLGDDWVWYHITKDTVWVSTQTDIAGPEVLDLEAGSHTFMIEPSWGFQAFSGVGFINTATGDTVSLQNAPDANALNVKPFCPDEVEFCPTGFKSVALEADGQVSWNLDFPGTGDYVMRVFYNAPAGATGSLWLDGTEILPVNFPATSEGGNVITEVFTAEAGKAAARTVTLATSSGGLSVDFGQLISVSGLATANEANELPDGYALEQNYPNPFNPTTNIVYTMGDPGNVNLSVYDVMGRKIATLVDGVRASGTYRANWTGIGAASGVYFYRLQTPVGTQVRQMVLLK